MPAMEIKNPRRLLIVCAPNTAVLPFLKDLTGSAPAPADSTGSLAGLTHEWTLTTPYYTALVPIWIDEIADLETWRAEFLKPDAREVVQAVGAWVYLFAKPERRSAGEHNGASEDGEAGKQGEEEAEVAMRAVEDIVQAACGYGWEGTKMAVALAASASTPAQAVIGEGLFSIEDWEDKGLRYGFEVVDAEVTGKNEFGERVGMARAREVLETNGWAAQAAEDEEDREGEAFGGFEDEQAQLNSELWGLKASLLDPDTDEEDEDEAMQVDDLERLMSQALAIRESGADLPSEERKRFAARAVNDLMKNV